MLKTKKNSRICFDSISKHLSPHGNICSVIIYVKLFFDWRIIKIKNILLNHGSPCVTRTFFQSLFRRLLTLACIFGTNLSILSAREQFPSSKLLKWGHMLWFLNYLQSFYPIIKIHIHVFWLRPNSYYMSDTIGGFFIHNEFIPVESYLSPFWSHSLTNSKNMWAARYYQPYLPTYT